MAGRSVDPLSRGGRVSRAGVFLGVLLAWSGQPGCAWLYEVPENDIPIRTREDEPRRRANEVSAAEGLNFERATGPAEGSGDQAGAWNPVSTPVTPKEKPFVFKGADGQVLYNGPVEAKSRLEEEYRKATGERRKELEIEMKQKEGKEVNTEER